MTTRSSESSGRSSFNATYLSMYRCLALKTAPMPPEPSKFCNLLEWCVLGAISIGACTKCRSHVIWVCTRSEHNNTCSWKLLLDSPGGLNSVYPGQTNIHQNDFRTQTLCFANRSFSVTHLHSVFHNSPISPARSVVRASRAVGLQQAVQMGI